MTESKCGMCGAAAGCVRDDEGRCVKKLAVLKALRDSRRG